MPVDQAVLAEAKCVLLSGTCGPVRPTTASPSWAPPAGDDAVEEGRAHLRLLASEERWVAPGWPAEHGGRGVDPDDERGDRPRS